jgi:hypothetical protein
MLMAKVCIDFADLDDGELPYVCMKCSAPPTVYKTRIFAWMPPWAIVIIVLFPLPGIITALIVTKRRRVTAPLCELHERHWSKRMWAGLIGFGVMLLPIAAFLVCLSLGKPAADLAPFLFMAALFTFVAWLIFMIVLQNGAIRASEITKRSITLQKVSVDFAEAYRQEHSAQRPAFEPQQLNRWDGGRPRVGDRNESNFRRPGPPSDALEKG